MCAFVLGLVLSVFGLVLVSSSGVCLLVRVGAQLGLQQMITIDIKVPNRMVGLSKF